MSDETNKGNPMSNDSESLPMIQPKTDNSPMAMIAKANDAGYTPEHIAALVKLRDEIEQRDAMREFSDALVEFQSQCPMIGKNRQGDRYKFANFEDVMAGIQPILTRCKISVGFNPGPSTDGKISLSVVLKKGIHTEIRGPFECPVPKEMRVNDTQKFGAAMRYAMRYALVAALNIVIADEDSDAANLDDKFITDEQVKVITDLIAACPGLNTEAFYRFVNEQNPPTHPGGIMAKDFERVTAALHAKAKKGAGQ